MSSIEFRKDLFADERDDTLKEIGKPTRRQDILGHVTGRSPFFDDHLFEGLLHLKCVRSPHHHARIRSIDISVAERMPGVKRVLRGSDVPVNLNTLLGIIGFGRDDEPALATKKVTYVGEPVVAVIAETERLAREACAAVRVEYEVIPHVLDVEEALQPNAPVVNEAYPDNAFEFHDRYDHQKIRFGDVEAAFAHADHVLEGRYQMSPIEQAPTETCGAIAAPETNNRYVCYTSTQALFFSLGTAAKILDIPSNRLHFIGGTVGGGFGGKVDSLHEPLAILGCILTGQPVRYLWDRYEEMQVGAPRGAERWYLKDAIGRDGRIIARKFTGYFDSGAYTRLSSYAILKAAGHLPGPYTIPNVSADVYCVFTNRTPATAMRGFGITAVDYAIECHMDKGAELVGMDPLEFRILNSYRDGDMKAHRRLAKNTALIECVQVAAEKGNWPIQQQFKADSSLKGGGGKRAELPAATRTDELGKPGARRRRESPAPQHGKGVASSSASTLRPLAQPSPQPAFAPPPPQNLPPPVTSPLAGPLQAAASAPPLAPAVEKPYSPDEPFQRGVSRPGGTRFPSVSGFRRR
ncbi:xanthine dehydrogenase family protein molybdopterin-binding subunit [Agrobacterium sp. NPDC058088]|uniref:xanthine dehydrogenase family protein molybdopterin-binding subunit n=1 Tax=Agrobacterium sp. NPDC058088 TaxID=3346335 RepID=UPI0036D78612